MLNKQKKYLGQHFLKNKTILEEMARAAEISKKDIVLEVGPGLGSLTEILAERAGKVIAIEKDRELIPILREKFKKIKNMEIIEGDILKIKNLKLENYKIVANIPYYITSRFLRLFLSQTRFGPKLMVLMVQKEVAERICAKPNKMNLLALSVQSYAKAEIIRYVSKNFFSPPPKVDSAIIKITPFAPLKVRGAVRVMKINPEKILALAKLAFQQKRKMLRGVVKRSSTTPLRHLNIPEKYQTKRPEELSLEDWIKIVVK